MHRWTFFLRRVLLGMFFLLVICGYWLNAPQAAHADWTSSINWNSVQQQIDGFGISEAFHQAAMLESVSSTAQSQVLDLLFSQTAGAGFSIVRNDMGDGGSWLSDGTYPHPTIEPSSGTYQWTGDEDQIWLMNQAKSRGTTNFMSTVWSPPAWMKSNNSVISGGSVLTSDYQAYANYLAAYIQGYQSHFGLAISEISLANEPNNDTSYSSSDWSASQFETFIGSYLKPTFQADGITTQVIIPEEAAWADDLASATLNDSVAVTGVNIIGAHDYGGTIAPFSDAQAKGKHVWETEESDGNSFDASMTNGLNIANNIYSFMTVADASAWNYWWGTEGDRSDNEALINVNTSASTYTVAKRLYTISNYSRFVRPGWVRIGATDNTSGGIAVTAFKNPANGQFAIVVINNSTSSQSFTGNLQGVTASQVTPYTTSASQNLAQGSALSVNNGSFTTTLPPQSVTTFTGSGSATTVTVDDSVQGTGTDQFNYTGSWDHCGPCSGDSASPALYNSSNSWSNTTNDTVTMSFTGTRAALYGVQAPNHGIGAISIDGGSETSIDFYASVRAGNQLLWTSSILSSGTHTLKLRVTGTKNASSSGSYVAVDRVDVTTASYYKLVNRYSGKLMEVYGQSTSNGGLVDQWTDNGGANQQWQLVQLSNGNYTVVNRLSGLVLDDTNFSTASGTQFQQWAGGGATNQQWQLQNAGGGYVTIANQYSGLLADDYQNSTADGGEIVQWSATGGTNQQWQLVPVL